MSSANASIRKAKQKKRNWEESYDDLKAFIEEHGHSNAKATTLVGRWAADQRKKRSKNELTESQIEKLDAIQFDWERHGSKLDQQWQEMFLLLKKYKLKHGHTRVKQKETFRGKSLGNWVTSQQSNYRNNKIKGDRKSRLEEIGFEWIRDERLVWKDTRPLGKLEDVWNDKFLMLVEYKRQHHNTLVPVGYMTKNVDNDEEFDLGAWVNVQRNYHRDGMLRKEREEKLKTIDFVFKIDFYNADASMNQKKWDEMFKRLEEYKERYGDCDIPAASEEDPELGGWARHQRGSYHKGTLAANRFEKLDSIEFTWDPLAEQWNEMFEHLKAYKSEHGDCLVADSYVTDNGMNLGSWVRTVRGARRGTKGRKELSNDKIARLDGLGFVWDNVLHYNWDIMFDELKKYKDKHGHCRVPQSYAGSSKDLPSSLGGWVSLQRCTIHDQLEKTGNKVYADRRDRLDSLGFEWEHINVENWNIMFEALKEYRATYGDCRVPHKYKDNGDELPRSLGPWVLEQKSKVLQKALENDPVFLERKRRLDEIDFSWEANALAANWERMFERLKQYRDDHGHCRVPRKYKDNCEGLHTSLGSWVGVQAREIPAKIAKNNHPIYIERKQRLNEIDFEWDKVHDYRWDDAFELLKQYHEEHGDCLVPSSYKVEGFSLGSWVRAQRLKVPPRAEKNDPTYLERKRRLESLNIQWDYRHHETRWQRMFEMLVQFKEENGHCSVPLRRIVKDGDDLLDLGTWCYEQRKNIPPKINNGDPAYQDRKRQLDAIGFKWDVLSETEKKWNDSFEELKQYQCQFGHCHVPSTYGSGRLYQWVRAQQTKLVSKANSGDTIYLERKKRLDAINFDYNSSWDEQWELMFKRLVEYKKEHGNCRVPYRNEKKEDVQGVLGIWVYRQRTAIPAKVQKSDPVSLERKSRLDSIQFEWKDVHSGHWDIMFGGLLRFQAKHGHTRVPREYRDENQPLPANLGSWVITQRRAVLDQVAKGNETFVERKQRLDEIGFPWRTRAKPKKRMKDPSIGGRSDKGKKKSRGKKCRGSNLRTSKRKQRNTLSDSSSSEWDLDSSDEKGTQCKRNKRKKTRGRLIKRRSTKSQPHREQSICDHSDSDENGDATSCLGQTPREGRKNILDDSDSSENEGRKCLTSPNQTSLIVSRLMILDDSDSSKNEEDNSKNHSFRNLTPKRLRILDDSDSSEDEEVSSVKPPLQTSVTSCLNVLNDSDPSSGDDDSSQSPSCKNLIFKKNEDGSFWV